MTTPTGTELVTTGAPPPRAARVYTAVEDVIPILDTAKFEHMQRIATIMASSSLIPDSLRCVKDGPGDNAKVIALPPEVVLANCFLIVNQATRWNMDPFAVAQCTSIVRGKLMYEGKLVHAVIEARLSVRLSYEFGKWDPKQEKVVLGEEGTGDLLGVIVSGTLPGEDEARTIEGYVGDWKTSGAGSPWRPATNRRQCRYRGAREWSRAHSPGVMLGVITDDEIDELVERRDNLAVAPRRALTSGFPEGEGPAPKRVADPVAVADPPPASEPSSGEQPSREDRLISLFDAGREAAGNGEVCEPPKALDDEEIEAWRDGHASKVEEMGVASEGQPGGDQMTGHADTGEVYLIHGEGANEHGRFPTYKDGVPWSTVSEAGTKKLRVFAKHAPTLSPKEDGPKADAEAPIQPTTVDDGFPGDQLASEGPCQADQSAGEVDPSPFAECHAKIAEATSWSGIKQAIRTLSKTEAWAKCEDEGKRMIRNTAWDRFADLREEGTEKTDVVTDLSLFRLWLEFSAKTPEEIDGLLRVFVRQQAYKEAGDNDKRVIMDMAEARKVALGAAK